MKAVVYTSIKPSGVTGDDLQCSLKRIAYIFFHELRGIIKYHLTLHFLVVDVRSVLHPFSLRRPTC